MGDLLGAASGGEVNGGGDVADVRSVSAEMIEVSAVRVGSTDQSLSAAIDGPRPGLPPSGEPLQIDGWVIGREAAPVAVDIEDESGVRWRVPVGNPRPDVAAAYPDVEGASACGFSRSLPWTHLPPRSDIHLWAVLPGERRSRFATIHLRRLPNATTEPDRPSPRSGAVGSGRAIKGPDFVIIGAQRGGTTSLHRYLGEHPDIILPVTKELHYFSRLYDRGDDWYRRQFPVRLPEPMITGEATPYYLPHPHAPRRLHAFAPAAKLIVLLRDPVDRAYSHYQHEVRRGHETLPFEEALAREEERLRGEQERMLADETYDSLPYQRFSYQSRGLYAEQLGAWFAFFPREQSLIVESERFYAEPIATVRRVTDFLGLPGHDLADSSVRNQVDYPSMSAAARRRLQPCFDQSNRDLVALLGTPFSWTNPEWT